jgi:hypothetical protein
MGNRKLSKTELNRLEIRRKKINIAMPFVKKLVSRHGLSVIAGCIAGLKIYEKNLRELESKKAEVAELERKIR